MRKEIKTGKTDDMDWDCEGGVVSNFKNVPVIDMCDRVILRFRYNTDISALIPITIHY